MRLSLFLIVISTAMAFSANSYSQNTKLTLELNSAKVKEVLKAIENQSEFLFFYQEKHVDLNRQVTLHVTNQDVETILNQLFAGTENIYVINDRQVVIGIAPRKELEQQMQSLRGNVTTVIEQPQQKVISGKVTDTDGLPLPGVSVIVKGTTIGTVTNGDGEFSLNISLDAEILQVSFVGMRTQEIPIEGRTTFTLVMEEDIVGIEEVVAVGYGIMKKSDITGSVVSVKREVLENRPRVNLEQMLQGTMAGITITVNASSAEGSSNTMLIRGKNSITASNNPLIILDGIPYSGSLSELNPRDIESIEILKDASASAIYGSRGSNGVILVSSKKGEAGRMSVNYEGYYSVDHVINVPVLMDGKTFYEAKKERSLPTTLIEDEGYASGRSTNWVKLATQPGRTHQHNLSFRGGSDKTKYYVSMGMTNAEGVSTGDKFDRYTMRINLDHKITKWITFNTNTQFGYYDRSGSNSNFEDAFTMNPLGIPFENDGSIRLLTWEDVQSVNPMQPLLYIDSDKSRRFASNNSILFDFPFLKGLTYHLNTGYDFQSSLDQQYRGRNTDSGRRVNGTLSNRNGYNEDWIIDNILSYKNNFDSHSIFITALYSAQSESTENHNISAEGFPNDVMTYYQAANAALIQPNSTYRKVNHLSQMLRANYTFDTRYLLTLTLRRDGYSAFGEETKFGMFPSAGIGWNLGKENFIEKWNKIDELKLRLSYGVNGNEAVSAYSTLPTLSSRNYVSSDDKTLFGFFPNRLGDPTLGWETTKSLNIGVDFGFFKGRLRGLLDMYWSNTNDLLLLKSITTINGTNSIIQNIGETTNRGIELQISSVNIHSGDFKWSSDLNLARYRSKIGNVGLTDAEGNYIDDIGSRWFIGEAVDVNFDYVFDGIWQENAENTPQGQVTAGDIKYFDINGDGIITPEDRQVIGSRIPDLTMGFTNNFQYKNFHLEFFLNGVFGITRENELLYTYDLELRKNRYKVTFWTPENRSNVYPRNDAHSIVNRFAMGFYRKSDFLRLQSVMLRYDLPVKWLDKSGFKKCSIFTNLKNLYTWTDWVGLDPELASQLAVPQTATYLFGIRIDL